MLRALQSCHDPESFILGAFYDKAMVGIGTFLAHESSAFHIFNGWDRKYAGLCPNQLLLWEAIKLLKARNVTHLNLGESHYTSLSVAKERWGACSVPLFRMGINELQYISNRGRHIDPSATNIQE